MRLGYFSKHQDVFIGFHRDSIVSEQPQLVLNVLEMPGAWALQDQRARLGITAMQAMEGRRPAKRTPLLRVEDGVVVHAAARQYRPR